MKIAIQLIAIGLALTPLPLVAEFVAGSQPSERPAAAPRIMHYAKSPVWYIQALHGVIQPYPHGLRFLEQQGAWYTPFTHPGMTGLYDIRAWHVLTVRSLHANR